MCGLYDECLSLIRENRQRALSGKLNCIPFPYDKFRRIFPGLEKEKYYVVTGNQKTAKSKWTDYTFLYEPFFHMLEHPGQYGMKVFYFTLEMSPRYKMLEFMSHLLFRMTGMRYSPREEKSVDRENPFPGEALKVMESKEFRDICRKWEECVEYISDEKNPTGINKYIKSYANNPKNGRLILEGERVTGYHDEHPEIYKIIVIDNAANLTKENGLTERENINKLSKYIIGGRDLLKYTYILVQHQQQLQEGVEMMKFNGGRPTTSGLGNSKEIGRDANMIWGIYSPFKMGRHEYLGYNIPRLRNACRFVEVLEDRDGDATGYTLPLLFDGAVTVFDEMPKPEDKDIEAFYQYADKINDKKRKNNGKQVMCLFTEKKRRDNFIKRIGKAILALPKKKRK